MRSVLYNIDNKFIFNQNNIEFQEKYDIYLQIPIDTTLDLHPTSLRVAQYIYFIECDRNKHC